VAKGRKRLGRTLLGIIFVTVHVLGARYNFRREVMLYTASKQVSTAKRLTEHLLTISEHHNIWNITLDAIDYFDKYVIAIEQSWVSSISNFIGWVHDE
jgi:hypothetical protein